MSSQQYYSTEGLGTLMRDKYWFNQAVRIGNRIETAGHGGINMVTGESPLDLGGQMDLAFENIDKALRAAGGKGWSQVYRIRVYVVTDQKVDRVDTDHMTRNMRYWMPNHQPIATCIGVTKLAEPSMLVEIEAWAVDE